jgi:hypothetical protein
MKAEFLELTPEGQIICAVLFLENGKVWGMPVGSGNEILVQGILSDHVIVRGEIIHRQDDPEAWFRGLPHYYNGSYLRARIVE